MARLALSSPWVEHYRKIQALFARDHNVHVIYDEENNTVKLYVSAPTKAAAIEKLMPTHKEFGDVRLNIEVVYPNTPVSSNVDMENMNAVCEIAFAGNDALSYVRCVKGIFTNDIVYVVFVKQVVQYFNDNLGDANGIRSTLYQDLAKEVLNAPNGVYFCTDVENASLNEDEATEDYLALDYYWP